MDDLKGRLANRVQLTTDGHRAYLEAVEEAFGADVDYAMLVKLYGAGGSDRSPETRYSPSECIGTRMEVVEGNPDEAHVNMAVHVHTSPASGGAFLARATFFALA